MQVQISRWGNSLGVRIPKDLAAEAGLREGERAEIRMDGDRIVISAAKPAYRLEDLLAGVTPQDMRAAFDWGPDQGREHVD